MQPTLQQRNDYENTCIYYHSYQLLNGFRYHVCIHILVQVAVPKVGHDMFIFCICHKWNNKKVPNWHWRGMKAWISGKMITCMFAFQRYCLYIISWPAVEITWFPWDSSISTKEITYVGPLTKSGHNFYGQIPLRAQQMYQNRCNQTMT